MKRVILVVILSEPVLDYPIIMEIKKALLAGDAEKYKVSHFADQSGLLAPDGGSEHGLLLVGLNKGTPLEQHDQEANDEVLFSIESCPVEDAQHRHLVIGTELFKIA